MARLNQIIAVEKSVKSQSYSDLSNAHKLLQQSTPLAGISRTYRSKDEDGDRFPDENTKVQIKASDVIDATVEALTRLFDVTATKDWTNCVATADVVVDGKTLVKAAPVPYLLFLEKQLVDLHTFVKKLPVLDQAEEWQYDDAVDAYATQPIETVKTKKVLKNHVRYEATKEHPAQVDTYADDVVIGYWKTVKFSGALPAARVNELLERVSKLQAAVKFAREEANNHDAADQRVGAKVLDYVFAESYKSPKGE